MKKTMGMIGCLGLAAMMAPAVLHAQDTKLTERLNHAADVLDQVMQVPDKGIPETVASKANCVVVIPDMGKLALGIGASHGEGVASCRTGNGWSAPVFVRINGVSFGAQIGGQATDLVLIAMNHHGLQDLMKDKVKLGGDAGVSAGPVGRNASAATDLTLSAEFLAYSRSKGLFAGIDLSGDSLSKNGEDTRKEYGGSMTFEQALGGTIPVPQNAERFVHTVSRYFTVSRDNH